MTALDPAIALTAPAGSPLVRRRFGLGLAGCVALAVGLRAFALLRPGGAWHYPVDYDEGVYFGAASLLLAGLRPYRDFLFVHPPGWPAIIAATSAWLGPVDGFVLARWVAVAVGGVNALLSGLLARRWTGPGAGLLAALLYATYPEAAGVERGPFLEPALNLACLLMAWSAERGLSRDAHRWIALAGVMGAVALSIKVWAVLWLVGLAWALWAAPGRRWPRFATFALALGLSLGVLVLPWAMSAPAAFVDEVVRFHLGRPADGDAGLADRLGQIFASRHLASPLLACAGVAFFGLGLEPRRHLGRMMLPTYLLTLAAFLTTRAYWAQYNAHLVASEAVLAGSFAAAALPRLASRWRVPALAALGLSAFWSARQIAISTGRTAALEHLGARVRALPDGACVFAFEPIWTLAGGRVGHRPPPTRGPVILDTYATMLAAATSSGARYRDVADAFAAKESQGTMRALLEGCDYAILGARGHQQLSSDTQRWLAERFEPLAQSDGEPDLWRRREVVSAEAP